jgi:hypothetical protein
MLRMLRTLAVLVMAALVAACGNGGGGGAGDATLAESEIRSLLANMILWANQGDKASAMHHMALQEFAQTMTEGKTKNVEQMTPAEKEELARACFAQLESLTRMTTLRDSASIKAAVAGAQITVHMKLKRAEVIFFAPRADGKGQPLRYKADFARYYDNNWHLIAAQEQFNR